MKPQSETLTPIETREALAIPAGYEEDATNTGGAARFLNISPFTLKCWRRDGKGPVFYKLGRRVNYRYPDLVSFRDSNRRGG